MLRRTTSRGSNRGLIGGVAIVAAAVVTLEARQNDDDIARAIVIGQAYPSGDILAGGFLDDAVRQWPQRVNMTGLSEPRAQYIGGDFVRVATDEDLSRVTATDQEAGAQTDVFSTIDRMGIVDRPIALYKSHFGTAGGHAVLGWGEDLHVEDLSYQQRGQRRPLTVRERAQLARERRPPPKDIECTTVPGYVDSAEILLTARVARSNRSIRLSMYVDPGCLGHLSTVYVLDVILLGREPRRFEFRHYNGLL